MTIQVIRQIEYRFDSQEEYDYHTSHWVPDGPHEDWQGKPKVTTISTITISEDPPTTNNKEAIP